MARRSALVLAFLAALTAAAAARGGDMLDNGARFPDFSLMGHHGKMVSSADFAGRTYLVYFYPKAATPG
jgi:peroxiredoxin Q/BCP